VLSAKSIVPYGVAYGSNHRSRYHRNIHAEVIFVGGWVSKAFLAFPLKKYARRPICITMQSECVVKFRREEKSVARPIEPTPILTGRDAEVVLASMRSTPALTPEKREQFALAAQSARLMRNAPRPLTINEFHVR
jgi:hypothetical protein